ncbi:T9SS type A sorting domain-containing protein [Flavobacterium sp. AG291]|uniref:T9SS type A sorting domain-containing protein n=1 Tax=Flavobacterium sp. AG291 TaxID=2184000 RepID=UPI000E0AA5FF|nr:T9SS type A sorting domain-containing protein [Flavobacterium sp. AG291]RDI16096.1 putative secreted protein (Por secretion system target) [Flavobacterium sp. AG291]
MKKNLLLVAALFAGIASYAQCEAVATLNEDFVDFTITSNSAQAFPQQCWSSIGAAAQGPWIYTAEAGTPSNQYAVYYTHMTGANVAGYIIAPELITVDGTHQLSFDTFKPAGQGGQTPTGVVTVEVGLVSSPTDATDFEAIGSAYTIAAELTTHANIVIPASETKKYIAFKFLSADAFNAAALDNVVYNEIPNPCPAVTTLDEDFSNFTPSFNAISEYCWSSTSSPLVYTTASQDQTNQYAAYYNMTAAGAAGYLVTPELSTIDGNHELSFDTFKLAGQNGFPAGDMTVQVGTLATAGDFENFVAVGEPFVVTETSETHANIAIPASETQKFIAFKIIGTGTHNAVAIDNVKWSEVTATPCAAVATLNEDFNSFTDVNENCWSTITNGAMLYIDGAENENFVTFYASGAPNTDSFLISPELTSLGGSYSLSFDSDRVVMGAGPAPGEVTIQLGTFSDNTDATTFVASGDPIIIADELTNHTNIAITATEGQKYIGFKIIGSIAHTAALIDNVKWSEAVAGINDLNKTTFGIFPNPSVDGNVTINNNLEANGTVNVFTLTGANVFSSILNQGTQNLNLSGLSAGMYIVKVESGNYSESKKLIIK